MGSLRHLLRQGGNPALLEALDKIDERGGGFDYVLVNAEGRRLSGERRYPRLPPAGRIPCFTTMPAPEFPSARSLPIWATGCA